VTAAHPEPARLLGEARLTTTDDAFLTRLRPWLDDALYGCTPGAIREATVVVAELLANAYRHARPPFTVRLTLPLPGTVVRIEVRDATASQATGWALGKGLLVVRGLCPDWGVEHLPTGKAVWAELPLLVQPIEV
jgi:hypothetical protein